MKSGTKIRVSWNDMFQPLIGKLVTITLVGEKPVNARIISAGPGGVDLSVVPDSTRE